MKVLKKDEMKDAIKSSTRGGRPWKYDIVEFLIKTPKGASDVELYKATRPDRLDISESKMKHNIASQLTYIKNDHVALIEGDGERRVLVAISEETQKLLKLNV